MSFSTDAYTGDGVQTDFQVTFPYILKEHVFVEIDGVASSAYTWFNDQTLRFTTAPTAGSGILIYRDSSPGIRLVDYVGEQAFNEETLDTDSLQAFYLIQEILDAVLRSVRVGDIELSILPNIETRAGKFLVFGSDGDIGVSSFSLEDVVTQAGSVNAVVIIQETAPTAPLDGQLWYQLSTQTLFIWDGDSWNPVCCEGQATNGNFQYFGDSGELTAQASITEALPATGDFVHLEIAARASTAGTDIHLEFSFDGGSTWGPTSAVWNIDSEISSNGDENTNVMYLDSSVEFDHAFNAFTGAYNFAAFTLGFVSGQFTSVRGWSSAAMGGSSMDGAHQRLIDAWLENTNRPTHVRIRAEAGTISGKLAVYLQPGDVYTTTDEIAGVERPLVKATVTGDTTLSAVPNDPLGSHVWRADVRLSGASADHVPLLEFQTVSGWSNAGTDIDYMTNRTDLFNVNTPTHSVTGGSTGVGVGSVLLAKDETNKSFSAETNAFASYTVYILNPKSTGEKWGYVRGIYMSSQDTANGHEAQAIYACFRFKEANPIIGLRIRSDGGETFSGTMGVMSIGTNNVVGQTKSVDAGSGTGVTQFDIDLSSLSGIDSWNSEMWIELSNVPVGEQPTVTEPGGSGYKYKTQKTPAPYTDRFSAGSGGTSGDNAAFYQAPTAMDPPAGSTILIHLKQMKPLSGSQKVLASVCALFDASENIPVFMHNVSIVQSNAGWGNTIRIAFTGGGTFNYRYLATALTQDETLLATAGDLVVLKDAVPVTVGTTRWNFTGSLVNVTQDGGDPTQANIEILPTPAAAVALDDLTDVNLAGAEDGNVLTRVGGVWVPQAPAVGGGTDSSGVWEVISTHPISGSPTEIDIVETARAWSAYDEVRFLIQDYYGSAANSALYGRVSTDGGSTFVSTVSYEDVAVANYNTTVERFKFVKDHFEVGGAVGNTVDKSLNAQVVMSGHAGPSRTHFRTDVAQTNTFLTLVRGTNAAVYTPVTAVDAIRLYPSAGTMQGGKIVVLGLNSAATSKSLGDLTNVDTTGAGNHDVLTYRSGTATWEPGRRNNVTTTDPGASNDNTQGYEEGSMWVNTTDGGAFICVNPATGVAVWTELTNQQTGGLYSPDTPPVSPDALDDEFNDSSFTGWTVVNDPGAGDSPNETTYPGFVQVGLPENTGTDDFAALIQMYKAAPTGTQTMTFIAKVCLAADVVGGEAAEFAGVSLSFINSTNSQSNGPAIQLNNVAANHFLHVFAEQDGTGGATMSPTIASQYDPALGGWFYLKLEKQTASDWTASNTYSFAVSKNGIVWSELGTISRAFTSAVDRVGLMFRRPKSQTGTPHAFALVDFFRRVA